MKSSALSGPLSGDPSARPRLARSVAMAVVQAAALASLLAGGAAHAGIFSGKHKAATPTVGNRIPILSRIEGGAVVDKDLAAMAVVLPPTEENADWAQPGGTPSKSYGNLALGAAPKKVWTRGIAGADDQRRLASAPVIGGGALFVLDVTGMLHAMDAATGAPLWNQSFRVAGRTAMANFGGGASYAAGKVYVATGVGDVAAVVA